MNFLSLCGAVITTLISSNGITVKEGNSTSGVFNYSFGNYYSSIQEYRTNHKRFMVLSSYSISNHDEDYQFINMDNDYDDDVYSLEYFIDNPGIESFTLDSRMSFFTIEYFHFVDYGTNYNLYQYQLWGFVDYYDLSDYYVSNMAYNVNVNFDFDNRIGVSNTLTYYFATYQEFKTTKYAFLDNDFVDTHNNVDLVSKSEGKYITSISDFDYVVLDYYYRTSNSSRSGVLSDYRCPLQFKVSSYNGVYPNWGGGFTFKYTYMQPQLTTADFNSQVSQAYQDGYSEGYDKGNDDGFTRGHDVGYQEGISNSEYTFTDLFGAIADTPVLIIRNLFDFDLFGVNLLTVVLSLFTALILFYIVRKLL